MTKADTYTLVLTSGEHDSLCWIADRYCAASVLTDCPGAWTYYDDDSMHPLNPEPRTNTPFWVGEFRSGTMWGYIAACHALEDYDFPPPPYSPCTGGTLAEKLTTLVASFPTDLQFRGIER